MFTDTSLPGLGWKRGFLTERSQWGKTLLQGEALVTFAIMLLFRHVKLQFSGLSIAQLLLARSFLACPLLEKGPRLLVPALRPYFG